jgi:four helix bundle protein
MTTMALIKRFEDIIGWQEARKLVKDIYQITGKGDFARDFGMRDQIQRAAVSVMTNIAEGFDCDSQVEFARFLGYSRRSAGSSISALRRLRHRLHQSNNI